MNSRIAALALIGAASMTFAGFGALPTASATAPVVVGGCPEGFEPLDVAHMEAIGPYILPRLVDGAGNGDGWVCGQQLPDSVAESHCNKGGTVACELLDLGLPFYLMRDDDVPGQPALS